MVSGGSSRGAKIRIFGLDMRTPSVVWPVGLLWGGIGAAGSVGLDAGVVEGLLPAHGFLAEEGVELLGGARYRIETGLFKLVVGGGIGIGACHRALELVDDRPRRAGGRNESDPARHIIEGWH